jgi:hypothetical protein
VIETVVVKFYILNFSKYQMQRKIPPSPSGVVPKLKVMWTVDNSLMDQNHPKIHSKPQLLQASITRKKSPGRIVLL